MHDYLRNYNKKDRNDKFKPYLTGLASGTRVFYRDDILLKDLWTRLEIKTNTRINLPDFKDFIFYNLKKSRDKYGPCPPKRKLKSKRCKPCLSAFTTSVGGGYIKDAKKYLKNATKGDKDSLFELFVAARSIQNAFNESDDDSKKELIDVVENINNTLEYVINM